MKNKFILTIVLILTLFVSGCGDQMYLEKSDIILLLGIDLDDKNQVTFYASTPVFNTEVKKNYHVMKVKAKSLREARYQFDALSQGSVVKGKIQTILIGKKFLQDRSVMPYLDVILRDPKDDLSSRVVMIDGPVEDILDANMEDKGRLGVVIRNMIDDTFKSGTIHNPNLQQFVAQQFDKRFSPMIPAMKVIHKEPKIAGISFLSHEGLYVTSIHLSESPLLLSLQKFYLEKIPISLYISSNKVQEKKELRRISIAIKDIQRKVKTTIVNGHFQFDIELTLHADLVERMFYLDAAKHPQLLKRIIEEQLDHEYKKIIQKTQKNKIDPIGFGVYARAKQYDHWKKIEDKWFDEYAKAKINISTKLVIINTGVSH
ncbi:Ger(x)C family spore germination protein [Shimazuella alba]|uniref:Ger(X)C family spore germination protein n=1 Tax=Shimazuella alba TaxID=2690964 RepID=A0A6I4VQF5_9BACL|nr:Ger(x)C family spore germination protein [Shimazuella alba]MXQ52186.1 Ger(x)C family spore germination protein [Shimazuella alba]